MRISVAAPQGQWPMLFGSLLAVAIVAGLGALASIQARDFYAQLVKPAWAPPPGVFSPVWTLLYLLMALAVWLVWRARGSLRAAATPLTVFALQLVLNGLWSWLFFKWRLGALAVIEVSLLWMLILVTLVQFWQIRWLAGALLVPYLLWVGFATALTAAVWRLNPALL
jgi:tryptophan-rich sensory protein